MTDIRVTQEAVEVVSSIISTPVARVTQQSVEVLASAIASPVARVTQFMMEVVTSEALSAGGATLRRVTMSINYT